MRPQGYTFRKTCAMRQHWIVCSLLLVTLFAGVRRVDSQINSQTDSQANVAAAQGAPSFGLKVSVDEVSLTFHAADAHGLPVNDLKLSELSLLDNGKPPRRILAFEPLRDFPIRAGILMDTSPSTEETRSRDRAIAIEYALQLLRQQTDQAFVVNFDFLSKEAQPWTNDTFALTAGIRNRNVTAGGGVRLPGTALFDAIYRTCLSEFGHIDNASSGNFILLFSDGEDNASHTSLKLAVDMCRHTNTAIYAFRPEPKFSFSTGPKILAELAQESGGRVFYDDGSEAEIDNDLRTIEADLRNQYRLIYKPPELKHDGSFHRVELKAPERVDSITILSGYYAPMR
jgi:Ca-activated chloride channel homolog